MRIRYSAPQERPSSRVVALLRIWFSCREGTASRTTRHATSTPNMMPRVTLTLVGQGAFRAAWLWAWAWRAAVAAVW